MTGVLKTVVVEVANLPVNILKNPLIMEKLENNTFFGCNEESVNSHGELCVFGVSYIVNSIDPATNSCELTIVDTAAGAELLTALENDNARFYFDGNSQTIVWRKRH